MELFSGSWALYAATAVALLVALTYLYLTSTHGLWQRLNVPFIKPDIIYGNMKEIAQFKKSQNEVFTEFYRHFKDSGHKFGGVWQLRDPVLIICTVDLVKDALIKNFPHFHDRHIAHDEHFDPLSAHLIALEGSKWKYIRSKLNPAFSTSKLKGMFASMRNTAGRLVEVLSEAAEQGEMMEMREFVARYTVEIIGDVAFGIQVNAMTEDSKFLLMGQKYFEPTKTERISQIISNTHPWLYKLLKLRSISKEVTEFFTGVVRKTMEYRRKNNIERNDFLHFLMKIDETSGTNLKDMEEMKGVKNYNTAVNENSIELTEGVVTAQAFVFFLAGYETSSSALGACLYELAYHRDIQDKLLQEVDEVIKKYSDITYESLQDLVYVEQVLEETLRMYPPVGILLRKCTQPYQIPDTNTVIPKGCQMFVPIYAFHHDPEYFPEPEEFRPERFSEENRKNIPQYAYMPFGHGPRVCIGFRLAMMELKLTLAMIIKNFKILKCEKTKPFRMCPQSFFLVPQDGFWVQLKARTSEDSIKNGSELTPTTLKGD
ncbi:hypothetical protein RUM44_000198 [Polyplax serrata]|uniref:Cytochrome P450 n=1 Tax=Polyplax serrata TaxID=468196 RepID=A0ABR1B4T9_POLSC